MIIPDIARSIKSHIAIILLLLFVSYPATKVAAIETEDVLVVFNSSDGQWLASPDVAESDNKYDLWADRRADGSVFVVRIDLDGNGTPELFIRTLCGNGGCEYPIFDGKSGRYMGRVFGSGIWLLKLRSHGLPVIEAFSHLAALKGTVMRYEFDGSQYVSTTSKEIKGEEEIEVLYRALNMAPKWQSPR